MSANFNISARDSEWAKIHCGRGLSLLHTVTTICCRLEQAAWLGLQRLERADANHTRRTIGGEMSTSRTKVEINVTPPRIGYVKVLFSYITWQGDCNLTA